MDSVFPFILTTPLSQLSVSSFRTPLGWRLSTPFCFSVSILLWSSHSIVCSVLSLFTSFFQLMTSQVISFVVSIIIIVISRCSHLTSPGHSLCIHKSSFVLNVFTTVYFLTWTVSICPFLL